MNIKFSYILWMIISLLLYSCSNLITQTSTITKNPTSTKTTTPSPTNTLTQTPPPSPTSTSTATTTITPTPSLTTTPSPTPYGGGLGFIFFSTSQNEPCTGENCEIWIYKSSVDGDENRVLTKFNFKNDPEHPFFGYHGNNVFNIQISQDGNYLAFCQPESPPEKRICRINTNGENKECVSGLCPFYLSPNGSSFIFHQSSDYHENLKRRAYGNFWIRNFENNLRYIIADHGTHLAWSPDSENIALGMWVGESENSLITGMKSHLFLINTKTKDKKQISHIGEMVNTLDWSPDGKIIVFKNTLSLSKRDIWGLYLLPLDGPEEKQITFHNYRVDAPAWSPDGNHIAYVFPGCHFNGVVSNFSCSARDLFIYNLSSDKAIRLTRDMNIKGIYSWSPDGTKIAFSADPDYDKDHAVYLIDIEEAELALLQDDLPRIFSIVWTQSIHHFP